MIRFLYPELFLLAIPLWFAFRRWGRAPGITGVLRVIVLGILLVALAGPEVNLGGKGIDIIVVADRSRSMPPESEERIKELLLNLQHNRRYGDRVGLVTFGSAAAVESFLSQDAVFSQFEKEILPDGSDLAHALHTALSLVNKNRPARILAFTDGESNGGAPLSASRRALELGVPIDYREFPRLRAGDVAVESLSLPETVLPREPFQYTVWVYADREADGKVAVYRDGEPIAQDKEPRHFAAGMNRLLFRDLLEDGGLHSYDVRLEMEDDPLPENNRGAGVVRVDAGPRLLVLNADGEEGNFVRALRAGNLSVDVASSKTHPITGDSLDRYRGVVLENVPAADFGRLKMERLAQFVEDLGGGLMLTGGERSFGTGGFFKSPLDEVLPVSMEMREEHRKNRLALAIALDRSGSMAVSVKGGKVKMDLANLGTAEAIRMLAPGDSVAVIAVDSASHVIQKMTPVQDAESIAQKVKGIQSMGGGIFVYEALVAAGRQLMDAEQSTKHIILFSDANDSEEPGDYKKLLAEYDKAGITTSVIGLGKPSDVDSKLLEDIARLGKGNIMFTEDAEELPRLFTQDTMSVARSSFIKKDSTTQPTGIPGTIVPSAQLMGEYVSGKFPNADGYNLSYLKPEATLGVVSQDEYAAPWSAFWFRGLGRVAAITLEVDGQHSGPFGKWDDYADFCITHGRWLLGGDDPDNVYLATTRDGQEAVVTLELDPDRPTRQTVETPSLSVVMPSDEREQPLDVPFQWTGPNTLQARYRLTRSGTYRTLVRLGGKSIVRGPAVTLPYSPEFMPRIGLPTGHQTLEAIGELTGGKPRIDVLEVLADPPRSARMMPLLPWLFIAAVLLLLTEIAGRRLHLWSRLEEAVEAVIPGLEPVATEQKQSIWPWSRARKKSSAGGTVAPVQRTTPTAAPQPAPQPIPAAQSAGNVFDQAKRRARKRLNE